MSEHEDLEIVVREDAPVWPAALAFIALCVAGAWAMRGCADAGAAHDRATAAGRCACGCKAAGKPAAILDRAAGAAGGAPAPGSDPR